MFKSIIAVLIVSSLAACAAVEPSKDGKTTAEKMAESRPYGTVIYSKGKTPKEFEKEVEKVRKDIIVPTYIPTRR